MTNARSSLVVECAGVLVVPGPVHELLAPGAAAYLARMALAAVPVIALVRDGIEGEPLRALCTGAGVATPRTLLLDTVRGLTPRLLLNALREVDADPTTTWLVCRDRTLCAAAATAGCAGAAVVGAAEDGDESGLPLRACDGFADAPRVMVPRDGGCWHR